jgi:general stress protein YciG
MSGKPGAQRCKATTKQGEQCRAAATGGGLCFFHANPNKASELGRKGGMSNRHVANLAVDPLPAMATIGDYKEVIARLIADVHAGKVDPKVASALAPLLNLQLRAISDSDLAQRCERLEKLLTDGKGQSGVNFGTST